jgi:hypothetical protein
VIPSSGVALCRVSYRDIEGIEHSVNVEADALYEAVAEAVNRFRTHQWDAHAPGPGCEFEVEVHREPPSTYKMALRKVEDFARYGTAKGPADILRKQRLRALLGMYEEK